MVRLLVVEDQLPLLRSLRQGLEEEGYSVMTADNGVDGCRFARSGGIDAVVLDLMLPDRDGLSVLRELRQSGFAQPVLIITARDAVEDRVRGLDSGADDYLVKPFAFTELLARLRALLRRGRESSETRLVAGDLEVDLLRRRVTRGSVEIDLTNRQFELLEYLVQHANEPVTREMIVRDVWKDHTGILTNVVEVCVNHLRKKLESRDRPQLLQTVRGVGYMLRTAPCPG